MRTRTKILLCAASFVVAGATFIGVGVAKGCPSIENRDPSNHYNHAILYGGGERNDSMRFEGADNLYRQGKFDRII